MEAGAPSCNAASKSVAHHEYHVSMISVEEGEAQASDEPPDPRIPRVVYSVLVRQWVAYKTDLRLIAEARLLARIAGRLDAVSRR